MLESIFSEQGITIILGLLGGLGIFLYGINIMGDALKALAGDRMKTIIEKLTNNVFIGILVGIIVTIVLQTSSGTTALSISLIRAGLMSLPQAIGIIMGANIGTTVTAFLFSFPKIGDYSLLLIGVGAIMIFFFRNKKVNTIGQSILGFGLLFFGMEMMGDGLKSVVKESKQVKDLLASFSDHPWLALLTGAGITGVVQSSSASTGIVQSLYQEGQLGLKGALPILFGNNIGTTVTAVIAAIGGSIAARRASAFHVFFNVIGALLFMILLNPFYNIVTNLANITDASEKLTIAYAHLIFNLVNTFALVWFINQITWLIRKIIPGKDDLEGDISEGAFNELIIEESPIMALESMKKVILHMANVVKKMLDETYNYAKNGGMKTMEEAKALEAVINTLDRKVHDYLVKITSHVDEEHSKVLSRYLDTIRDLERIGDHCENILEVCEYINDHKGYLSEDAWEDLDNMFNTCKLMLDHCIIIIRDNDKTLATKVIEIEESVDRLEKKARKRHTMRVNDGICTSETGINYIELLSNLERVGDHCCNMAEYAINEQYHIIIDEEEVELT